MSELDVLDPIPETYTLSTGFKVELEQLRTRQFFRLLRVITHGAAGVLLTSGQNLFSGETEDVVQRLLSMLVLSIPDAEDEALQFLASMVRPAGLHEGSKLDSAQQKHNDELLVQMGRELYNPSPEDTVGLIEAIVKREAKDLAALGKKFRSMLEIANKTGQLRVETPKTTSRKTKTTS